MYRVYIFFFIQYIMVRYTRKSKRMVGGRSGYQHLVGSRTQVANGTAYKTSYGKTKSQGGDALTKRDLVKNKHGRYVSRVKAAQKTKLLAQLRNAGYTTQKGKFGAVKIGSRRRRTRRRRSRRKRTRRKSRRCRHKSGRNKGKFKKCNGRSRRR